MNIDEKSVKKIQRSNDVIPLGRTGMNISVLGLGTWQWGDRFFWGYGSTHDNSDIQAAFQTSLAAGINFFDTAEVYGLGKSEKFLGGFVKTISLPERKNLVIGSKFSPLPHRLRKDHLRGALNGSLRRLGMNQIELYQVHWPYSVRSIETWAEGLADAIKEGLIRAAGVSNYNPKQLKRAWLVLKERGYFLASNQVEYNLLNRKVEKTGLLTLCQELGVTLIAYSPLAQGLLTGKYTPENQPKGFRGGSHNKALLEKIQPMIMMMGEMGEEHGGKTPAQVALNWTICKGAVAIPGAKNQQQALENAGALGWRLAPEEVAALDRASDEALA
jgi:aryl-alcohol dehydrogenase-like predicted oxidoreductase